MPAFDVTKIITPEALQQIGASVVANSSPVVAPAPVATTPNTLAGVAPAVPNSVEMDMANAQRAMDNEFSRSLAETERQNNANIMQRSDNILNAPIDKKPVAGNPVTDARENMTGLYSRMLEEKRKALEKQRTSDIRLAAFNSLGNALRTMVQPLGWAAGGGGFAGATAGVQPYDNRQYLESFNRAVKASDDLRNLGSAEDEFAFKLAADDYKRAQAEEDYQRRRNETNEDFFARLDRQQKIKSGESYTVLIEKRRENAVKAFYTENARRISHKQPPISFTEFINLDGLGKEYYGNWNPSAAEVRQVEQDIAMNGGAPVVETPAVEQETPATTGGAAQNGVRESKGLTPEEEAIIAKWEKYDKNKNGVIEQDEARHGLRMFRPKFDSDEAEAYAKAIAKRDGKKSSGKSNASSTTKKNVTARDIMK